MTWKSLTFMDKGGWLELLRRPSLLTSSVNTLVHLNLGRALEQLLCNLFQSRLNTTRPVIADLDLSRFKSLESFTASFTPPHASYLFHWIEYGSVDRWTVVKVTLNLLLETGSDLFRPEFRPLDLDWSSFDSLLDQPSCVFGPNFSGFLEFTLPDNVEFDHMAELKKAIIKALPKTAKRGMLRVRERDNEGTRLTSSEDS
ncbi:hypothetical protein DL96DRAFT_1621845 [Flagelloscypha sp. PMI_526]|nr:hypothetical protein DL96DRAFT_1621845 [Flagelloscypha sp. PMI_526]